MKTNLYKILGVSAVVIMLSQSNLATAREDRAAGIKVPLPLDSAISYSVRNSRHLQLSYAKTAEAVANVHEMKDNRLPEFKVSGSYLRLNSPDVSLKVKLGSSSGGEQTQGSAVKVEQAAYGLANLSLPLFSGFRIKYGIESANYLEKAARYDAENDKEEVVLNTINAYGNLFKSMKTIELIEQSLVQQQQRVTEFSNLEQNGLMARNDLLKARLQQSNIELTLLDAQNNYNIACINMGLMLGIKDPASFVADSNAFAIPAESGNANQWEEIALKNRKDLSAIAYRKAASGAYIKSIKGEYYPGLAVTGGYIAADVPNLLTLTNALNLGIGLQYNMSSLWKTGAKLDVAKARLHQLEANEGMMTDQLHLQINQTYENYLLSMCKIEVYAKAIEQATENYRISRNKYENNLVTTTDLLEADIAQLQSRLNFAFAKVDAAIAYKKLQQTAGVLTEAAGLFK
ncbi:MAG: TolC family protein [Taibaiella sp.]|nr:TolC family protein [Taibaiella sp.]